MVNELYFIRHGQTEQNRDNIIQGYLDGQLTEKGKKQLYELGTKFQGVPLDVIIRSEMGRTKQSTQHFLEGYGKELPVVECPYINERYLGEYQGKKIMDTPLAKLLKNPDPTKQITGAELFKIDKGVEPFTELEGIETIETLGSFRKRGEIFCYEFLPQREEKKIAVIGHDWMHSNIINVLLNEEPQLHTLGNGCFNYFKLSYNNRKPDIVCYHLNKLDPKSVGSK